MTNQQEKAINILNRVRERYIRRITEFIVENEEDLMDSAEGEASFVNTDELAEVSEKLRQLMLILEAYRHAITESGNSHTTCTPTPEVSFQMWAEFIRIGDFERATLALAYLFQCKLDLAEQCMQWFTNQLRFGHPAFEKIQELRDAVKKEPARAITLLHECFGLVGDPAIYVLHNLQNQA